MHRLTKLMAIAFALLYSNLAWAQLNDEQFRMVQLRQRYPNSIIYLGPPALNDIHTILREPDRRKRIDSQVPPIPLGAKTLHSYISSVYRSSLDSTRGVVLVVIDFANDKAFEKKASDASGTITQLPWDAREVRAVAVLTDEILRTRAEFVSLVDALRNDKSKPLNSWAKFRAISDAGLIEDESASDYVRLLVGKVRRNEAEFSLSGQVDPISFTQVKTLLVNQEAVEMATAELVSTIETRNCSDWETRIVFNFASPCIALRKASLSIASESLKASKSSAILGFENVKSAMQEKFSAELAAARSERGEAVNAER